MIDLFQFTLGLLFVSVGSIFLKRTRKPKDKFIGITSLMIGVALILGSVGIRI